MQGPPGDGGGAELPLLRLLAALSPPPPPPVMVLLLLLWRAVCWWWYWVARREKERGAERCSSSVDMWTSRGGCVKESCFGELQKEINEKRKTYTNERRPN